MQETQLTLYLQVMLNMERTELSLQVWAGLGQVIVHQVQHKQEYSSILLLPLIKTVLNQLMLVLVQMEQLH